jgi:GNAT superfamily N-acetyltransferase
VPEVEVQPIAFAQIRVTAEVLARAFDDSPIMTYLLPRDRARTIGMRAFFIGGLVDAYKHGEAWVVTVDGEIAGGAIWLSPGSYPPGIGRQVRQLVHLLAVAPVAPTALIRSLRYLRKVEAVHPKTEHWYLATLGVDPPHQGRGYGTRLLDVVLPRADQLGVPTYLETDKERNLAYYARHRFEETDQLSPAAGGPPTWTMWRDPVEP